MNLLWAPWRMPFIAKAKKTKGCIFCKAYESNKDKVHYVLERSTYAMALLNIYPYNNGHLMVAPIKHTANYDEIPAQEWGDIMDLMGKCKCALDETLHPQGYNVGINMGQAAGAGIAHHLHVHLVPRWSGDMNFMPVFAATKVLPQALSESYKQILDAMRNAHPGRSHGRKRAARI